MKNKNEFVRNYMRIYINSYEFLSGKKNLQNLHVVPCVNLLVVW
jgi:hypothetical protein